MILKRNLLFFFLIFLCGAGLAQKVRTVNIQQANSLGPGPDGSQRIVGNVVLSDSSITMYCDSAYYYSSNKVDAFSHIRIVQTNGTLNIAGDLLKYDGETKTADLINNVVMNDQDMTLRTKAVYYDIKNGVANYYDSAYIVNKETQLTSKRGTYFKDTRVFHFKKDVVITNPKYRIYSDTVNYNTESKVTEFFGPTHIITDKDSVYCERGWYNTITENSHFYKNPWIISEGRKIKADTLTYLKSTGFGKAVGHMEMIDTAQNVILKGNFAIYNPEKKIAIVTDSALMIQIDEKKDSLFVHADTIRTEMDTSQTYRLMKVYYKVRMFKKDLQGKCDSLFYSSRDSVMELHGEPVLWSEKNQLTSEFIQLYMKNKKMERMELKNSAFLIGQEDSLKFTQVKGKNMTGYFADNELKKLIVKGNGQTVYFPKDENDYIGMNKTTSTDIIIYMKDKKPSDIILITKPEGTLYPLKDVTKEDMYLKDFLWQENKRPKEMKDIFVWK